MTSSYPITNKQHHHQQPYNSSSGIPGSPTRQVISSAWQVIEQPPPPTLREILNAYKSKGDGDREMLLAMLNAKSSEDQRIAATATLHHKLLDLAPTSASSPQPLHNGSSYYQQPPQPVTSHSYRSPPTSLSKTPPLASPLQGVTLPPIHVVNQQNTHKRSRCSQSPPPFRRRHSGNSSDYSMAVPHPNETLPPSPPFSSPGRSTTCSELTTHHQSRGDAMAIGSLLSSEQERDSEWPSRTSAERDRERDATYHKPGKVSG